MLLRTIKSKTSFAYLYSAVQNRSDLNVNSPNLISKSFLQLTPAKESSIFIKSVATQVFKQKQINFAEQINGKTIAISCSPDIYNLLTAKQILSGTFLAGFTYQLLLGSMNYFTLGVTGIATAATLVLSFGRAFLRKTNQINDIEIGTDGLIHISFFRKGSSKGYEQIAVDKHNFKYNAVYPNKFVEYCIRSQNGIWCEINNQYFWINREGLKVNNMNFHKLL